MKKGVLIIFVLALFISCEGKEPITEKVDVAKETSDINNVLNTWHKNAAETNFEAYFTAMTNNSVFVGTDATEVWGLQEFKDFSKPYFDKGSAWSFNPIDRNVYIDEEGKIAWFDELLATWMGVCRGSGVLKKTNNVWKIEHYVLSLTVPNDNMNEVIKINKVKDAVFLKKYNY